MTCKRLTRTCSTRSRNCTTRKQNNPPVQRVGRRRSKTDRRRFVLRFRLHTANYHRPEERLKKPRKAKLGGPGQTCCENSRKSALPPSRGEEECDRSPGGQDRSGDKSCAGDSGARMKIRFHPCRYPDQEKQEGRVKQNQTNRLSGFGGNFHHAARNQVGKTFTGKIYEAIKSGVNVKLNLVGHAKVTSGDFRHSDFVIASSLDIRHSSFVI